MERMTKRTSKGELYTDSLLKYYNYSDYQAVLRRLAHYEDLAEQGRLVELPCAVGGSVYYIAFGKVYEGKCHAITFHQSGVQVHLYDFDGDSASYAGKRVFRSRAEAEAALAASGKEVQK